jgi:signal transduction histidine kinase
MRAIQLGLAAFPKSAVERYALALGATAVALACRVAFDSIIGDYAPFLIIFPAVIFSAWYCGLGPSIASVVVASLGEMHLLFEPHRTFAVSRPAELVGVAVYLGTATFIVVLAEKNRRSMVEARAVHEALEGAVKERTRELEEKNAELLQQTDIVRELSRRLLQTRDEERRHIARELHDSVGQLATAVRINMQSLINESQALSQEANRALTENMSLTDQLAREVRMISYLLHPPLLDELGLPSALSWFVEGFAQRSKIQVKLELQPDFGRLARDLEIHLFRIVQECLTNVHRHSGSATACIRLSRVPGKVRLELEDAGRGIPEEKLRAFESRGRLGVGISGMRERARQFGGTIEITSSAKGTTVVAIIPVANVSSSIPPADDSTLNSPLSSEIREARSRGAAGGERTA